MYIWYSHVNSYFDTSIAPIVRTMFIVFVIFSALIIYSINSVLHY